MSDKSNFKCLDCGKQLKNKQSLDYHVNHYVCQKLICPLCQQRFKSSLGFRLHTKNKICVPDKKIQIDIKIKNRYHPYTLPRSKLTNRDVMNNAKALHPNDKFTDLIFENKTGDDMVVTYIKLALANREADQYWSCYVNNRREPFVTVYEELKDDDPDVSPWSFKKRDDEYDRIIEWAMNNICEYLKANQGFIDSSKWNTYWSNYLFHNDKINNPKNSLRRATHQNLQCIFINLKKFMLDKSKATKLRLKP